jgi:uncharacterized protein YdhG (YjbR/CyaY superfamily)
MKANDKAMNATASAEIDAHVATLPEDVRLALDALRQTIRSAAPEAVEAFSYGAPAFKYRGRPLVSYNAAKHHCSLYVMSPAVVVSHRDELGAFDTSKGTIRFTPDAPLPKALVTKLVRARMAETNGSRTR